MNRASLRQFAAIKMKCLDAKHSGIKIDTRFEELAERLRGRATEDESKIQHRLHKARDEAEAYPEYDYLIVNAEISKSVAQLETIVNAERLKVSRLRGELAPWKS